MKEHETDHINLLFNNAGIGGGGSFLTGKREEWDRVFGIDWGGVYNCARAFVPLLVASDDGYLVNTSSVNGFWASLGPGNPHTAYTAAKFAVKGFSEALIEDFRVNAPHVKVAVVMPGHIGTDIVSNSRRVLGGAEPDEMSADDLAEARVQMGKRGMPVQSMSDDDIRGMMKMLGEGFKSMAPVSAAQAATIILDGGEGGEVADPRRRRRPSARRGRAREPGGDLRRGRRQPAVCNAAGVLRERSLFSRNRGLRACVRGARVQHQGVDEDHVARARGQLDDATGRHHASSRRRTGDPRARLAVGAQLAQVSLLCMSCLRSWTAFAPGRGGWSAKWRATT